MEINKEIFDCAGIYAIKNIINGKIYVGKSKNCYKRLHQHKTDLTIDHRNYNENQHLLNAYKLYGDDKFYCYILEKFDNNLNNLEELLSIRELFWMKELKTLDKNYGYNLRFDSDGKCFVSEETSQKISNRLKKEWSQGIRDSHSEKLINYWKNNDERRKNQSKLFSEIKRKYYYLIKDLNGNVIFENGTYNDLKSLKLHSGALSYFSKYKTNLYKSKNYIVERLLKI